MRNEMKMENGPADDTDHIQWLARNYIVQPGNLIPTKKIKSQLISFHIDKKKNCSLVLDLSLGRRPKWTAETVAGRGIVSRVLGRFLDSLLWLGQSTWRRWCCLWDGKGITNVNVMDSKQLVSEWFSWFGCRWANTFTEQRLTETEQRTQTAFASLI